MIVWNARQCSSEDYNILISEEKKKKNVPNETSYKKSIKMN